MLKMVINKLVVSFTLVLVYYEYFANAECNNSDQLKSPSTHAVPSQLHHIIEFKKRDQIRKIECQNKVENKKSNLTNVTTLGLHRLLHVRSQKLKQQTGTRREDSPDVPEVIVIKHHENTTKTVKAASLQKLQIRKMTIKLLRKIVEEHFPGGKLTVEQKIKALKLLGKIMKLKIKNNESDLKAAIDALSPRGGTPAQNKTDQTLKLNEKTNDDKDKTKDDSDHKTNDGDLYATIANGPDVPKLPPSITEKDPDHGHSNVMPVGIPQMPNDDGTMPMHHQTNNDNFDNLHSEYSDNQDPYSKFGEGGIYNTDDFYSGRVGLGGMSMMDDSAYARSRMPFSPRFRHRPVTYEQVDRGRYDNDEDEGDDDDEDDDEDADNDEGGRTRSYVHRHNFDDNDDGDDDNDDDDDEEYHNRFDRKDKIAKLSKNNTKTDTVHKTTMHKL